MKVAVATQDMARINAHLGWTSHLMIYEVSEEGYAFLKSVSFGAGQTEDSHNRLIPRLETVKGCHFIFAADVGLDGERELAQAKVIPIRQFAGQPVALALEALRDGLRGKAPAWLRQLEQRYRQDSLPQ